MLLGSKETAMNVKKWLKAPKNRLILALVPILLLWAYYVYLVYIPEGQSSLAGSITLIGAILLEAVALWPFARRWSRQRILVILAFIGLIIWSLWTLEYLGNLGPADAASLAIDGNTGAILFHPTLSTLLSDLVAWPHVALGLIYQIPAAGVVTAVLTILGMIAPFVVLPAAALSVVAQVLHCNIPPYLDGSRQLTLRQRIILLTLGIILTPGLQWCITLISDFASYSLIYSTYAVERLAH